MPSDNVRTPMSRVFLIENGAGPANVPAYQGRARALGPSWSFGDRTPVREPDPDRYGGFKIVDSIKGERDLPTLSLENRLQYALSDLLRLAKVGCPLDIQIHFGQCQNPQDFNGGWDKVMVLEIADISNWGTGELGALEQGQDSTVLETVDLTGLDFFEIVQLNITEMGETEIVQEIIAVDICDSVSCGACGIASNGCQVVFALTLTAGGSPGLAAELIFTQDAGATLGETNVTTLAADEDPSDGECIGTRYVVISNDSDSIHYAPIADILAGTETWVEIATGIVAAGSPNALWSSSATESWIAGDGGYVYKITDVTAGATVQTSGSVTSEDLGAIHGIDELNIVAVGANNAVIRTTNGGDTWVSVTGPAVGVVLNAIWMRTELEWFIGDASGQLWYTRDAGVNWTEKTFPGSGAGVVRDIKFATPTVGYLAHDTATPAGRILRTIDGGNSWYVLPEGTGSIPANDRIGALAACGEDVNVVFGGGLDDGGTDGIFVKGA